MDSNLPNGSKIEISHIDGFTVLTIPHNASSAIRYLFAAFMLFWLFGWFNGFKHAVEQLISGNIDTFLIFWLCGRTVGGIFAIYFLYRLLRKSIPEKITLNRPYLKYDTGIPPFKFSFNPLDQKDYWKSMFPKREIVEFSSDELKSITLREFEKSNRLTIDSSAKRIELATAASEVEREWLYEYLKSYYS